MRIFTLLAWSAIALSAQGTVHTQGRLISDSAVDDLYVEADGAGRVPVETNGTFILDLPKNNSLVALRIVNRFGEVIQSTFVSPIQGGNIEVPFAPRGKAVLPGKPISARRWVFKPTWLQRRLLAKADDLLNDGRAAESVAALEAIALTTPGWFEVWNNLGARQYSLGRFESAVKSFQSALRLDPNASQVHTNIGLALIHLGRHEESARHATRALQLDPASAKAAYVLALTLAYRDLQLQEAIELLEGAVEQLPDARLPLAALFYRVGNYQRSRSEAHVFLRGPHTSQRPVAEEILRNADARLTEQRHQKGSHQQGGQPQ